MVGLVLCWVVAVLWVDRSGPVGEQHAVGAATWGLLLALLRREAPLVRVQTGVVVALATLVEYTFSPLLGAYTYRLGDVPAYVPPGHGLVYLSALCLGRSPLVQRHLRWWVLAVVAAGGTWAVHGLLAERADALGAFWFVCLLGFLAWGRSRGLYVGAFVVVSWLELWGTHWEVWEWAPRDPVLAVIPMGNPPSGAAGGYGWFDLYAVLLAPVLLRAWARARRTVPVRAARAPGSGPGGPSAPSLRRSARRPRAVTTPSVPAPRARRHAAARSCTPRSRPTDPPRPPAT